MIVFVSIKDQPSESSVNEKTPLLSLQVVSKLVMLCMEDYVKEANHKLNDYI